MAKTHRPSAPPPSKRHRLLPSDPPRVNLSPPTHASHGGGARGGVAASSGHTRTVAVGLSWSVGRRCRLPLGFCPMGATSRNSPSAAARIVSRCNSRSGTCSFWE